MQIAFLQGEQNVLHYPMEHFEFPNTARIPRKMSQIT